MPVKNEFFEIQFYIKNKNGLRITDYLYAYIFAPYARDAEQLLIATYANGDEKKIWHTSPQVFGIEEKMKSLNYYDYRFQIINEKNQRIGRDMHDIIISDHPRHAEQILIGKYADGDKSRISYSLLRSYKYDELHNLNTLKLDTYDFTFYLKDEKGKQITKNLHYYVDSWNYWEAEEKFLAAVAGGDKTKVWYPTGRRIGPSLPTILKQEYEEEQKRKKDLESKLRQQAIEDRRKEAEIKKQKDQEERLHKLEMESAKTQKTNDLSLDSNFDEDTHLTTPAKSLSTPKKTQPKKDSVTSKSMASTSSTAYKTKNVTKSPAKTSEKKVPFKTEAVEKTQKKTKKKKSFFKLLLKYFLYSFIIFFIFVIIALIKG